MLFHILASTINARFEMLDESWTGKAIKHLKHSVIKLETLQSLLVEEHVDLNLDVNLRSTSLVSFKASIFTSLHSTMVLIVDSLMHCFGLVVKLVEVALEAWVLLECCCLLL